MRAEPEEVVPVLGASGPEAAHGGVAAGPGRNPGRAPPRGAAIPGLNRFPRISAPKQFERKPTVRAEIIRLPTPPSPSAPPAE